MKSTLFKRILAATLAALAISSALTGCQNGDVNNGESSSESESVTPPENEPFSLPLYGPTAIPEIAEGKPLYVSPDGSDENDGSQDSPFKTPEKAIEAVKSLVSAGLTAPVTVYFHAGDYKVTSLDFTGAGGTSDCPVVFKAYGDGEVSFNAGTTLKNDMFKPVTDQAILARLSEDVRDKVKVVDLTEAGLTLDDIGPLYAWGTSSTASQYNDGTVGNNSEVFMNDIRLTLARWPNYSDGLANFNGVIDHGDAATLTPGITRLGDEALARARTWATLDGVGVFAYFMFTWADMAAPVKSLNLENGDLQLVHYSNCDYKDDGEYYFYNVLEELDVPGEYYIDRNSMKIYIYPPEGSESSDALVTTVEQTMITGTVSNIRFDSITFKGSKSDIIVLIGDNISIVNSRVLDGYGSGIGLTGYNNLVHSTEVAYMGKKGVVLGGGDRATLTHGNNLVENCYIHHFQEVYRTYQQGIWLGDCGNRAYYNEIAYTPHTAMGFSGNEHDIAYNYIHDVVYEATDAGALYAGGNWTTYGNVIRYNLFKDIGAPGNWASAIYWDDGMSAGEIYGNIVDGCEGIAILLGGGRDIKLHHNLVISDSVVLQYDDRFSNSETGWDVAKQTIWTQEGIDNNMGMWSTLLGVPYMSEPWISRYPRLSQISKDLEGAEENPNFPGNPAFSEIHHNVFIGPKSGFSSWNVAPLVYKMSSFSYNTSIPSKVSKKFPFDGDGYDLGEKAITNYNITDWEQLPWQDIGRYDNKITGR